MCGFSASGKLCSESGSGTPASLVAFRSASRFILCAKEDISFASISIVSLLSFVGSIFNGSGELQEGSGQTRKLWVSRRILVQTIAGSSSLQTSRNKRLKL